MSGNSLIEILISLFIFSFIALGISFANIKLIQSVNLSHYSLKQLMTEVQQAKQISFVKKSGLK